MDAESGVERYGARNGTEGIVQLAGVTCSVHAASYSGSCELDVVSPRYTFACMLGGTRDDVVEESWDGLRQRPRRLRGGDYARLVPRGQELVAKYTGSARYRYVVCEIERGTFARVLGDGVGDFDLMPLSGPNPIAPGMAERVASLCQAAADVPRAYAESLTVMLVVDLFRASATKAIPREPRGDVGPTRFKLVLDFIEESLDRDIGLHELASLADLSVTHFAHAFKTSYGVSPYRYISQRRVKRAETLLRTTGDTVAGIARRVGYTSQSRFSQMFVKLTGSSPSAYRSGKVRSP